MGVGGDLKNWRLKTEVSVCVISSLRDEDMSGFSTRTLLLAGRSAAFLVPHMNFFPERV